MDYLSIYYRLSIEYSSIFYRLFIDHLSIVHKFAFTPQNQGKSIIDKNPSIKIQSMKTLGNPIDNRQVLSIGLDWQPGFNR